jgi:hypothetical protein
MQRTVKLQAPPFATGVSFEGEDYRVDDGVIEVPASAEAVLRSHGYTTFVPKAAKTAGGSGGQGGKVTVINTSPPRSGSAGGGQGGGIYTGGSGGSF